MKGIREELAIMAAVTVAFLVVPVALIIVAAWAFTQMGLS